ncbi:hypothetical protein PV396_27815 [Streptomyces sp. ME02-8801-2C]|uniref:hypothetical protein n=1 Tax=Streptomyces sp. ME02-8801-2C TaxID=3028680 RepID=UPI0029BD26A9|nr:hypothetical protein [Streptomyces sp. ME02-8801-2C]MDX3455701.1 hypothetical protein [Streptomyces sp. ME02-8801-2C]
MRVRIPAARTRIASGLVLCAAAATLLVTAPAQAAEQPKSVTSHAAGVNSSEGSTPGCQYNWRCWG